MRCASKRLLASIAAGVLCLPSVSLATNGYFLIGYGTKSRSVGGAGVAFPQDSLAAGSNPAGMAHVGTRFDVGADLFNPPRRVAAENGIFNFETKGSAESGSNLFLIPNMGGNYQFNRKMSVGMSVIGNGANTRYDQNFFDVLAKDRHTTLGVNLISMQMLPTLSYKLSKTHSVGASLALGIQTFRAYGLQDFTINEFQFSSDFDNLTDRGNDWSYGAGIRVGWMGHFFDKRLSLGVNYASRMFMTKFDKYKGLFANEGEFDIPEHYALGAALKLHPKLTILGDVQWINYSDIGGVGNDHPNTTILDVCTRPIGLDPSMCDPARTIPPEQKKNALGGSESWGFGWDDALVYKLGAVYEHNDRWTFRAGLNYGDSVIPDNKLLFNMLAPAVIEWHATVGFTYNLSPNSELSMSYVHGFERSQTCDAPDCVTMLTQGDNAYVAVEMEIRALGISYAFHF
jgi:long-chain fatty acid transport protein